MRMSPVGRSCGSNSGNHGNIKPESAGTATARDPGWSQSWRVGFGGSGIALRATRGRVPRRRGQPGLRRKPAKLRARSLARVEKRHPAFGPPLAVADSGRPALRSGLPTSPTASHGAKKQTTTPRDISAGVLIGTFLKSFDTGYSRRAKASGSQIHGR